MYTYTSSKSCAGTLIMSSLVVHLSPVILSPAWYLSFAGLAGDFKHVPLHALQGHVSGPCHCHWKRHNYNLMTCRSKSSLSSRKKSLRSRGRWAEELFTCVGSMTCFKPSWHMWMWSGKRVLVLQFVFYDWISCLSLSCGFCHKCEVISSLNSTCCLLLLLLLLLVDYFHMCFSFLLHNGWNN